MLGDGSCDGVLGLDMRSSHLSPGTANDDRWSDPAEINLTSNEAGRDLSKPRFTGREIAQMGMEVDNRLREIKIQRQAEKEGKSAIGVLKMKDIDIFRQQCIVEAKQMERKEEWEDRRAAGLCCLYQQQAGNEVQSGGDLCAAWSSEVNGWRKVKVVMDSGAAELVAPRSMAPQFAIVDSAASKAGVYYTSANGGRLDNLGQQDLPIALANGCKAMTTFQIADVSRPLMSVGKICQLGNRVLFGSNGGVILNLGSGQVTPFEKEDGVYVFTIWIPPLSETPCGRPQ